MFNNKLKEELARLRNELASMRQIKDSFYSELLVLEIEPDGRIWNIGSGGAAVYVWRLSKDGMFEAGEAVRGPPRAGSIV